jgi:hypothetical protein
MDVVGGYLVGDRRQFVRCVLRRALFRFAFGFFSTTMILLLARFAFMRTVRTRNGPVDGGTSKAGLS